MRTVYVVPGIGGSALNGPPPESSPIWISYSAIITGGLAALGLGPDGVTPTPPCQLPMTPGPPLSSYYGATMTLLGQQLGAGWSVVGWGYDWRLDLAASGAALAAEIIASVTAAEPCVLVCHSAGGLVARVAWSVLAAAGQTGLISRIITLGTPHQGSYSPVQLFGGGNSYLIDLGGITLLSSYGIALIPFGPLGCGAYGYSQSLAVLLTWPSLYQLLAFLGSPDATADPFRVSLYQASNWRGETLSQAHLTAAATVWDRLMASPATLPPANALTTIAGSGLTTPDVLVAPQLLGGTSAYGSTPLGDGAVTVQSALIPASWQYTLPAAHLDLPWQACLAGLLADEVQAVRTPQTPVPPVVGTGGNLAAAYGPPPMSNPSYMRVPAVGMGGSDC